MAEEHRLDRWYQYVVAARARGLDDYAARAEASWRMGEPLSAALRADLVYETMRLYPREQNQT